MRTLRPNEKIVEDFLFKILEALNEKYIEPAKKIEIEIKLTDDFNNSYNSTHSLQIVNNYDDN